MELQNRIAWSFILLAVSVTTSTLSAAEKGGSGEQACVPSRCGESSLFSSGEANALRSMFGETNAGSSGRFDVGGYVRFDFIHDFNSIGSTDSFDPLTIPTDGRQGENTRLHARQTRLNLTWFPGADDDIKLFIEGDFFGSGDSLRLRHGYLQTDHVLVGQTWTTFMDESILPKTIDFESPRSVIIDRRAILRWTESLSDTFTVAAAIEDPQPQFDVANAPAGEITRPLPDFIARARWEPDWGHIQTAGLIRMLRYRSSAGSKDSAVGWGINVTGHVDLHESDRLVFQTAFGHGFESYRNANDAAVDAAGNLKVIPAFAWLVGYELDWNEQVTSTFVYSRGNVTNASFQLPGAGRSTEYVAANVIVQATDDFSWGVEYLYGTREDKNRAHGDAHRVQFMMQYNLP